jgi:hypothetical protein
MFFFDLTLFFDDAQTLNSSWSIIIKESCCLFILIHFIFILIFVLTHTHIKKNAWTDDDDQCRKQSSMKISIHTMNFYTRHDKAKKERKTLTLSLFICMMIDLSSQGLSRKSMFKRTNYSSDDKTANRNKVINC